VDRIQLASWFSLNYIEFSQRPMNYLFKDTAAGSKSLVLSVNAHPGPHLTGGLCKVVEELSPGLSRICPPACQIFLLDFNADFSTFLDQIQDEILQQSSSQNHHEE
jgi:hypothetical protein